MYALSDILLSHLVPYIRVKTLYTHSTSIGNTQTEVISFPFQYYFYLVSFFVFIFHFLFSSGVETNASYVRTVVGVKNLIEENYPQIAAVGMAAAEGREPRIVDIRWEVL